MPELKLPGARTGIAYYWAVVLSPVLLLAAGASLLVLGFWRDVDSVAAIGAVAIVASLILPRMRGAFEIGPGGVKGDFENEIYREVIEKARAGGVDAQEAIELAAGAAVPPWTTEPSETSTEMTTSLFRIHSPSWSGRMQSGIRSGLAEALAREFVDESVGLERESAEIVKRVATERGWDVRQNVRRVGPGGTYNFDFVLTTQTEPILIEAVNFRNAENLSAKATDFTRALQDHHFLAAFLVIPNHKAAAAYVPEKVQIVPVGDLERKLREVAE
jgi:hypothetical protein